jgi:pimeloyl-ACP methyl ester carboxylesterase
MTVPTQSVTLPSGVTLPYVEQGQTSGVPVLLLHGVTDSLRSFEPVLPLLPGWMHVFALTQRGHGDASRPATGYRLRDFAADVAAFMDALRLRSAIVVGHSLGASVAQRFATDYPDRTRGLVLAGAFPSFRDNGTVADFWESEVSRLSDPIAPEFVRDFQKSALAGPVSADLLETVVAESLKVPASVWKATFAALLNEDTVQELDTITAPTLLVWGSKDAFCTRGDQDTLLEAIPGARLAVYSGAGHAVHWEEPDRFVADLTTFVRLVGVTIGWSNRRAAQRV